MKAASDIMSNLSLLQKVSAILLVLAKLTGIGAMAMIMGSLANKSFLSVGIALLTIVASVLLISCIITAIFSYGKESEKTKENISAIDSILADPEVRAELKKKQKLY